MSFDTRVKIQDGVELTKGESYRFFLSNQGLPIGFTLFLCEAENPQDCFTTFFRAVTNYDKLEGLGIVTIGMTGNVTFSEDPKKHEKFSFPGEGRQPVLKQLKNELASQLG